MLRQEVQRPGILFQVVEPFPLLIPRKLLRLDAFDNSFLCVGFTQYLAAGEPLPSGHTERTILAPLDFIALLQQEPQQIIQNL